MTFEEAVGLIEREHREACLAYGCFHSRHEGYAVLKEEIDELWDVIRLNGTDRELAQEATQVAAMAVRILIDLEHEAPE